MTRRKAIGAAFAAGVAAFVPGVKAVAHAAANVTVRRMNRRVVVDVRDVDAGLPVSVWMDGEKVWSEP